MNSITPTINTNDDGIHSAEFSGVTMWSRPGEGISNFLNRIAISAREDFGVELTINDNN